MLPAKTKLRAAENERDAKSEGGNKGEERPISPSLEFHDVSLIPSVLAAFLKKKRKKSHDSTFLEFKRLKQFKKRQKCT